METWETLTMSREEVPRTGLLKAARSPGVPRLLHRLRARPAPPRLAPKLRARPAALLRTPYGR